MVCRCITDCADLNFVQPTDCADRTCAATGATCRYNIQTFGCSCPGNKKRQESAGEQGSCACKQAVQASGGNEWVVPVVASLAAVLAVAVAVVAAYIWRTRRAAAASAATTDTSTATAQTNKLRAAAVQYDMIPVDQTSSPTAIYDQGRLET